MVSGVGIGDCPGDARKAIDRFPYQLSGQLAYSKEPLSS